MMRKCLLYIAAMVIASAAGVASDEYNRIARVSHLDGHVSFQHPGEVDWTAASINMALQPGDRLYTGEDGRIEIEIDDGSVLHLAEKTDLEFLSLNDDIVQVRILTGLATITLRSSVAYEIGTPAAVFNTLGKGVYRFDVVDSGDSDAIVRKGLLEAANDIFSRQVESGELIHVTAGDQGTEVVSSYNGRDAWDEWTDRRDADFMAYESRKYIPDNVYMGVSDLDAYGRWIVVDAYGPAWIPNYADASWSPYCEGRWWYRPGWGWTWVSYEPWGWLPYHYGRWYYNSSFGWCWLPGVSFGFHFWSPALVRFYQGPSWISWCPLGPGDYYNVNNYYYSRSYSYYLNNLRLMQHRSPGDLVNRNIPGAFRTVQSTSFVNGSIARNMGISSTSISVPQPWREGRLVNGRLGIEPTARSYAPAPERPVVRPTTSRSLPSVVRTAPSVVPSGGPGSIIRVTPGNTPSSFSRGGGRGSSNSASSNAATGMEPGRSGGTVDVPDSVTRDRTPLAPVPEAGRGRQAGVPATAQPAPGNSSRSNSSNSAASPEPAKRAPAAPANSGSKVVNPPRSQGRPSGSSTSSPGSAPRRMESTPSPAHAPQRTKPQERSSTQQSGYGRSNFTPGFGGGSSTNGTEAARVPASRAIQPAVNAVREAPRNSWENARPSAGRGVTSYSSPGAQSFSPPASAGRNAQQGSSSSPAGGARRH